MSSAEMPDFTRSYLVEVTPEGRFQLWRVTVEVDETTLNPVMQPALGVRFDKDKDGSLRLSVGVDAGPGPYKLAELSFDPLVEWVVRKAPA